MAVPERDPRAVYGRDIGKEIAQALGLPGSTIHIELIVPLDGPVEVVCRYYPNEAEVNAVEEVLQHYHIMRREAETA